MFVPSILVAIGIYFYLLEQANPFTPPVGHVFLREPALEGVYRLEHHQGRNATASYVGDTLISCRMPTYYLATIVSGSAPHDCGFEQELNGMVVRVERVRVPTKNKDVGDIVVRISHDGHDYWSRSDAAIRELWVVGTEQDARYAALQFWIYLIFLQLCVTYRNEIFGELMRSKK